MIGYARVSTGDQRTRRQVDELRAAGCICEEYASGADRARPVLAGLLRRGLARGDTLVVVKLDRLARSLEHLLEVVHTLEARGAYLRVLGDPIDTATPQGRFMLQMLGAVAELERALIRERVVSGLARASRDGRKGGKPRPAGTQTRRRCAGCGTPARMPISPACRVAAGGTLGWRASPTACCAVAAIVGENPRGDAALLSTARRHPLVHLHGRASAQGGTPGRAGGHAG